MRKGRARKRVGGVLPPQPARYPSAGPGGCHRPDGAHGEGRTGPGRGRLGSAGLRWPPHPDPRLSPLSDIFIWRICHPTSFAGDTDHSPPGGERDSEPFFPSSSFPFAFPFPFPLIFHFYCILNVFSPPLCISQRVGSVSADQRWLIRSCFAQTST